MSTVLKVLREPLFHFLLIGAALFGLYRLAGSRSGSESDSREQIVVTSAQIENLADAFERTWRRSPTRKELQGLVQDHIKEEVLYREALRLRLDQDDTVVRRRLRQKMEFISTDLIELREPTDEELRAFLDEHKEEFSSEPRLSFQQVYFSTDRRGGAAKADAEKLVRELADGPASLEVGSLGDAVLLPHEFSLAAPSEIAGRFGDAFAKQLLEIEPGRWAGPVESAYGVHLVRISERVEGHVPALSEVREGVEREWLFLRQKESQEKFNLELRDRYDVVIRWPKRELAGMTAEAAK